MSLRGEPYLLWRAVDQRGAELDMALSGCLVSRVRWARDQYILDRRKIGHGDVDHRRARQQLGRSLHGGHPLDSSDCSNAFTQDIDVMMGERVHLIGLRQSLYDFHQKTSLQFHALF